jgi:dihydroxyacetone kinase
MAYLLNKSADFADEFIAGLAAAYPSRVRAVSGGLVRRTAPGGRNVAVVIGGGSGHYPAFGGLVGEGLAHGAALGNLFASPSARQVQSVAMAVQNGAGIVFCFGNYAGDVLNFRQARDRLLSDGIESRIVTVTDDVSSADSANASQRRGVAGGLAVYKVASAAADSGIDLDGVEEIARRANERVRTLGVAFSGCTLPGATEPLFTVPTGRMAVGMGIHGEPGISETDIPTADGLAELLVAALLAEIPIDIDGTEGARAVVLLNGLGSVKYEELFIVYRRVAELLDEAGVIIADAEVGEMVTSFEMAGVSLTLFWLDDELEEFWNAPADAPAYRKGSCAIAGRPAPDGAAVEPHVSDNHLAEAVTAQAGTPRSREAALVVMASLDALLATVVENADELGKLDAVAGDGDHGIGMERGATAGIASARTALAAGSGAGGVLTAAADAWSDRAGGTSGVLWGILLESLATAIGNEEWPDASRVAEGFKLAAEGIGSFGKARLGDKTILDALLPFADELESGVSEGLGLDEAWSRASASATVAANATTDLVARIGRARPHAAQGIGTPDPGAVSFALIVTAVGSELAAPPLDNTVLEDNMDEGDQE